MSSLAESSYVPQHEQQYWSEAIKGHYYNQNKQLKSSHKIFDKEKLLSYDLIVPTHQKSKEDDKFGTMKNRRKTIQVKKEKVRLEKREDYDNDDLFDENLLCSRRNSSIAHQ